MPLGRPPGRANSYKTTSIAYQDSNSLNTKLRASTRSPEPPPSPSSLLSNPLSTDSPPMPSGRPPGQLSMHERVHESTLYEPILPTANVSPHKIRLPAKSNKIDPKLIFFFTSNDFPLQDFSISPGIFNVSTQFSPELILRLPSPDDTMTTRKSSCISKASSFRKQQTSPNLRPKKSSMYATTAEFFTPKGKPITPPAKTTTDTSFNDTLTVDTSLESVESPSTTPDTTASNTNDNDESGDGEAESDIEVINSDHDVDFTNNYADDIMTDTDTDITLIALTSPAASTTSTEPAEDVTIKSPAAVTCTIDRTNATIIASPANTFTTKFEEVPFSSPHTHPITATIANTSSPLMNPHAAPTAGPLEDATMTDAPEEDEAIEIANQLQQQEAEAFKLASQARVNAANALLAKSFIYSYHEDKFAPTKLGKKFKTQSRLWNASPTPTHFDPLPKRIKGQDYVKSHVKK